MPDVRFGMCEMFASAEAKIDLEKDNLDECYEELTNTVRTELKRQYQQWKEKEPIGEASI